MRKASNTLYFVIVMISLSGCAQLMGSLRRDLDDGDSAAGSAPTVGGRFADHGFLSEDMPEGGAVGHADRNPASGSSASPGSHSWLTPDRVDANRRDAVRGDDDGQATSDTTQSVDPSVRRQYKNGARATRADFVDESQNEGSLWASDGQTNYYFTKNKIRGVGDIITVNLEQALVSDVAVEARRTLSPREREYELMAAQERLRMKAMGITPPEAGKDQVAASAAAPARTPAASPSGTPGSTPDVEVPQATYADVDVSKSLELKAGDQMMGEIIERYPNGNYKIRATKKVPYKGGPSRLVTMIGVVKGTDIAEDDTVSSGKLYEYRVEANR